MAGMPMDPLMIAGMVTIPVGLAMAAYGLTPRLATLRAGNHGTIHFHVADHLPLSGEHWKLVIVLMIAVAVDVMKPATLGFVMPGMTEEYGIDRSTAGVLALVALTGTTVGSVIWGRAADLIGRRATILLSALMFIGTAICGAMPSFNWNLIMCFLMGMSAGGLLPITFTLMAEMIPTAHRGWLLVALGGIGTSAGYLLASGSATILEPLFSWRILWMLGLPTGLLIIFLDRYIPESPRYLANAGLVREARGVLGKFGGIVTRDGEGELSEEPVVATATGLRDLIAGPYGFITLGLLGAGVAWGLVNFGFLLWLPTNLREMGFEGAADGILARSAILSVPGSVVVIWLYHRWSSVKALVLFTGLTALSLLAFFIMGLTANGTAEIITILTALLLVSASGVIAMLIPYAAEIYPVHLRGTGAGLVAASSKFGGILGAGFGVLGLFADLAVSAALIAVTLVVFAVMLLRYGIDTRGLDLEKIHAAVVRKSDGA